MTNTRFHKVFLSVLSVIMLMSVLCTSVSAADTVENLGLKYGEIVPTDKDLSAQISTYNFYGDSGLLYFMRISKGQPNARFAVEIYSDAQYKNQIRDYNDAFDKSAGNKPFSITWPFKTVKSGTYYGKCYVYVDDGETKTMDTSSLKTFKININRLGKRQVKISKVSNTVKGPNITWLEVPTASQYKVYRKEPGQKKWSLLKTVDAETSSYTDTTAKSGVKYSYTVKALDGKFVSLYNKEGVSIYALSQPVLNKVTGSGSQGYAKVSWKTVPGASGYYIYRKGGSLSEYKWERIATVKGGSKTSYIDKKALSDDWNYTYTVKAYKGSSSSSHSSKGVDFDYISAPKITAVAPHATGMRITWANENTNVTTYYIYRKNGKSWKRIGTTTGKSFIDKTAVSNTTYTYTVKAASNTNPGAYSSTGKSGLFIGTPKLTSLTFNSKNNAVVKWSAVNGASTYRVYRKIDKAEKWTLITTVSAKKLSYSDSCAKQGGQKFTYTVRAVNAKGKTGAYISSGISSVFLLNPEFTLAQQDNAAKDLAVEIKWEPVKGATKYNVYRRLPGGKWETLIKNTAALTYIDKTAVSGTKYEYTVRAYDNIGSLSRYTAKAVTAVAIPVISNVTVNEAGTSVYCNAVENATYKFYRAPYGTTEWKLVGEADTPAFVDSSSEAKLESFIYSVTAIVNGTESVKSAPASNITEITATAKFSTNAENVASITLEWSSDLAEAVIITKSADNEEPVELPVFPAEIKSYVDENIESGKTYTYTLTAQSSNKLNGSATVTESYPLPPLEEVKFTNFAKTDYNNGDPTCTFSWLPVEFATEYNILRAEDDGDYKKIGTVSADEITNGEFSYTDNINAETKYSYTIEAISNENRKPSCTKSPSFVIVYAPLDSVSDLKATSELGEAESGDKAFHVTLTWSPTQYAEKYVVERKIKGSEETVVLTTLVLSEGAELPTTFTDKTAQEGVTYIYKVTASNAVRGSVSNEIEYVWSSQNS